MTTATKKIKGAHFQKRLKKVTAKRRKNPSAFFGKLKDEVDGLAYQKRLRNEWR